MIQTHLSKFLDAWFFETQPESLHARIRAAVRWLEMFVDREPKFSDVCDHDGMRAFYLFLAQQGIARSTARDWRLHFDGMCKLAAEKAIIPRRPILPQLPVKYVITIRRPKSLTHGTPWWLYWNRYRPVKLKQATDLELQRNDAMFTKFVHFCRRYLGKPVLLQDIDESLREAFRLKVDDSEAKTCMALVNGVLDLVERGDHRPRGAIVDREPEYIRKGPITWPERIFDRAMEAAGKLPGKFAKAGKRSDVMRVLLLALRDTGLRLADLRKIERVAIAPNGVTVVDTRDGLHRVVRMRTATMAVLPESEFPFAFPIRTKEIGNAWREIRRRGCLPRRLLLIGHNHNVLAESELEQSDNGQLTVAEFFENVYLPLRLRGKSDRTEALYRCSLVSFGRFLKRRAVLEDFTDDVVSAYLSSLGELGRSPHTIEKERVQLLAMWRFACKRGMLRVYPNVPGIRLPRSDPKAWTREELVKLFDAVDNTSGMIGNVRANLWWRALLLVIWDTGERIGATRSLQWSDFDLDGHWLTVPAQVRKGKTADKTHRLHPDTVTALRAILHPERQRVFEWPFVYSYLWTAFGKLLERAGLDASKRCKFHKIRRTVASFYEQAGGDATRLLDHSRRATTEKWYIDPRVVPVPQACEKLFRPGSLADDSPET